MSWTHIREQPYADDPRKEVAAMQYIHEHYSSFSNKASSSRPTTSSSINDNDDASDKTNLINKMMEAHVILPYDLLADDQHLYSIMPYCDGNDLFHMLEDKKRFGEDECRYWMNQILKGVETLQQLGICHRDLSLENILVHQGQCLIIDMGMCLRVPQRDDGNTNELEDVRDATQYHHDTNNNEKQQQSYSNWKKRRKNHKRFLLKPQGVCGKFKYMSPEIKQNEVPFDGYAVDMWSVGVMLFMMCTGYEPWEIPCDTDTRFYYFTRGYVADMIAKQRGIKLSDELLDLLQWMMVVNPRERPCLSQVRAHPWMMMGRYEKELKK
mmetsp:Transcript_16597/g.24630  ORF Transcript_16597/g.24630 Transcript_16597/m.24630 type:complete len:324 (+) Transcript_16597:332-1303(+)